MIGRCLALCFLLLTCSGQLAAQCAACEFHTGNLVENGDFESGNTGFTTEYNLATVVGTYGLLSNEGDYTINSNAANTHTFFEGLDHTNPPWGSYMIVNGSSVAGTAIWCQTIDVIPGLDYNFSAWARNVDTNPDNTVYAELQFTINGDLLGPEFTADGGWEQFAVTWNAGAFTSIDLCIFNQQFDGGGNDFGIDDISFDACYPYEVEYVLDAGPDIQVCSGAPFNIGTIEQEGFDYTWEGLPAGVDTDESTTGFILDTPLDAPLVEIFVLSADTGNLGCFQIDTVSVTVMPLPIPDLGADVVICEGENTVLDAGAGWDEVEWSTTEDTQTITVDAPGDYAVTVLQDGCEGSDALTVIQPLLPEITLPADTSICEDQVLELLALTPGGVWSSDGVGTTLITATAGTYTYTVDVMGCTTSANTTVDILHYPIFGLDQELVLCPGDTVQLTIPYIGLWSTGDTTHTVSLTTPGPVSVEVGIEHCVRTEFTEIIEYPLPWVDLGEDLFLCAGRELTLSTDEDEEFDYLWNTEETFSGIRVTDPGLYFVDVSNACATVRDSVIVWPDDCGHAFYAPNAFTPNNDGLNDYWHVHAGAIQDYHLQIFNRWGELVHESFTPDSFWIGDHMGSNTFAPQWCLRLPSYWAARRPLVDCRERLYQFDTLSISVHPLFNM